MWARRPNACASCMQQPTGPRLRPLKSRACDRGMATSSQAHPAATSGRTAAPSRTCRRHPSCPPTSGSFRSAWPRSSLGRPTARARRACATSLGRPAATTGAPRRAARRVSRAARSVTRPLHAVSSRTAHNPEQNMRRCDSTAWHSPPLRCCPAYPGHLAATLFPVPWNPVAAGMGRVRCRPAVHATRMTCSRYKNEQVRLLRM